MGGNIMPSNAMKYFFESSDILSTGQIIGYFDFGRTGISGIVNTPSEQWTNNATELQIINSGQFWNFSGFANFNKQNYAKLNLANDTSISFIFPYELNESGDNIFIGNSNNISGINFGINHAKYPYLEYNHKIYGPVTVCYNYQVANTGIINFSINDSNSASIGVFDIEDNNFKRIIQSLDVNNVKKSNLYYIGGHPDLPYNRFLSAKIPEIFIYNPDYFSSEISQNQFISGLVCSVAKNIITGIVSGQTGILYGDIIEVKECSVEISGVLTDIILSTGSGEYFATYDSFLDFNNETFNTFTQQILTGYYYGYATGEVSYLNCSNIITGKNNFEYESGYVFEYSLISNSVSINKPEYLYNFYKKISLSFDIDNDDVLTVYGYSGYDPRINFINLFYNNSNDSYGYANIIGDDFSGLYYNGILQKKSTGYSEVIQNGLIEYLPSDDYFISGTQVLNNKNYGKLEENNSLIDFWPYSYSIITGQINSGQTISNLNFNNSLIYLNGQLLNSGIDYSGVNKILINIDSGYNVITVQQNILNFYQQVITGKSGFEFVMPFNFNKNMSLVWLNGQRLYLNKDYFEFKLGDISPIINQNSGVIIYNNQF
jgi:hypothetical protein